MKPQVVIREKLPNGDLLQWPGCYRSMVDAEYGIERYNANFPPKNLFAAVGYVHKGYRSMKYPFPKNMRLTESDYWDGDLRSVPAQKPGG